MLHCDICMYVCMYVSISVCLYVCMYCVNRQPVIRNVTSCKNCYVLFAQLCCMLIECIG